MITKDQFVSFVENDYLSSNSYIDSIMSFCEMNEIEPESILKFIQIEYLEKVRFEAENKKLIKKEFRNTNPSILDVF